jgi:hypothetical protein
MIQHLGLNAGYYRHNYCLILLISVAKVLLPNRYSIVSACIDLV